MTRATIPRRIPKAARARHTGRLAGWLLLAAAPLWGCPGEQAAQPDARVKLAAEKRYGNDPELIVDFANLRTCVYRDGRLDSSCPELQALQRRIRVKARKQERRPKVITTLVNLLESRRELTRLVAARSLRGHHQLTRVSRALRQALEVETSPAVRSELLRQVCWRPADWALKAARRALQDKPDPRLRVVAATCLARSPRPQHAEAARLLADALKGAKSPRVRRTICAALGRLRQPGATSAMVGLLDDPQAGWRCATALARMGTAGAHQALLAAATRALDRKRIATSLLAAIAAGADQPFFKRTAVVTLLRRAAQEAALSGIQRARAIRLLAQLNASAELEQLRKAYAAQDPADAGRREVRQALSEQ